MTVDIIVVALIAFSAYMGYKKGFVKTVSKLCCLVVSIIVAKLLHPVISMYVMESPLGEFINEKISAQTDSVFDGMPSFLQKAGDYTANSIADSVVSVVTILLIVVITYFVAKFIVNALNIVAKFPIISTFNRLLGLGAGFFVGIFIVYLIIAILVVADTQNIHKLLEDSVIAYTMYRENILMNLIF